MEKCHLAMELGERYTFFVIESRLFGCYGKLWLMGVECRWNEECNYVFAGLRRTIILVGQEKFLGLINGVR